MAKLSTITLQGSYNSQVTLNKPTYINADSVVLSENTNIVKGDKANANNSSFAIGKNSKATGQSSLASAEESEATGDYSSARGYKTKAQGKHSIADGVNSTANKDYSYIWNFDPDNTNTTAATGTFNIWTDGGTNGFFINGKSLSTIISTSTSQDAAVLTADAQTFTGKNTFNGDTTLNNLTLSNNTTATLNNGVVLVATQSKMDSSNKAASTAFVTDAIRSLSSELYQKIAGETTVKKLIEEYLKAALGEDIIKTTTT
jgi:trimeric autotransporter adhesin